MRVARGERLSQEAIEPANQISAAENGVATTTKVRPRKTSLPAACGSFASTNCGRKVTKKTMIFGFRRLTPSPFR